jgi:DNA repair protein RadC
MPDSLHKGHRERLRDRFHAKGVDSFEDHQVLELLLFQAIPRADTNPITHQLMRRINKTSGSDISAG